MTKERASSLELGAIVQNTYEVLERLGSGGMGATYKARHIALGHFVCIKVINDAFSKDPKALELFKREANLLRDLALSSSSDAIVKIETLLRDSSGAHFLIMEYIDGQPLSHYINLGARLREDDLIALAERLLQGLAAIHKRNIVHRDISPDNIMVPQDDILNAKILDFGLASDVAGTEKSIIGDSFAGKVTFASPEQLGLAGGAVSAKSDLYSLGLVLLAVAGLPIPGKGSMATAVDVRRNNIVLSENRISKETRTKIEALLRVQPQDRLDLFTYLGVNALSHEKSLRSLPVSKRAARGKVAALGLSAAAAISLLLFLLTQWFNAQTLELDTPKVVDDQGVEVEQTPSQPLIVAAPESANQTKVAEAPLQSPSPEINQAAPNQPETSAPDEPPKAEPDPPAPVPITIETARALIAEAQDGSIASAHAILSKISADGARSARERAAAFALIGWIYDPQYRQSPIAALNSPNADMALEAYETARNLGLYEVQSEINRLSTK